MAASFGVHVPLEFLCPQDLQHRGSGDGEMTRLPEIAFKRSLRKDLGPGAFHAALFWFDKGSLMKL
jgi:hypothetical protein